MEPKIQVKLCTPHFDQSRNKTGKEWCEKFHSPQGCRFGRLCERFHDWKGVDARGGQCGTCGAHSHPKAECARPGGGKYDESKCPIAKARSNASTAPSTVKEVEVKTELPPATTPVAPPPDPTLNDSKKARKIRNRSLRPVRARPRVKLAKARSRWAISDSGAESHMRPIEAGDDFKKVKCDGADGEFSAMYDIPNSTIVHGDDHILSDQRTTEVGWIKIHCGGRSEWVSIPEAELWRFVDRYKSDSVTIQIIDGVTCVEVDDIQKLKAEPLREAPSKLASVASAWFRLSCMLLYFGGLTAPEMLEPIPVFPGKRGPRELSQWASEAELKVISGLDGISNLRGFHRKSMSFLEGFDGLELIACDWEVLSQNTQRGNSVICTATNMRTSKFLSVGQKNKTSPACTVALCLILDNMNLSANRILIYCDRESAVYRSSNLLEALNVRNAQVKFAVRGRGAPIAENAISRAKTARLTLLENSNLDRRAHADTAAEHSSFFAYFEDDTGPFSYRGMSMFSEKYSIGCGELSITKLPPKYLDALRLRKDYRGLSACVVGIDVRTSHGLWLEVSNPERESVFLASSDIQSTRGLGELCYRKYRKGPYIFLAPEDGGSTSGSSSSTSGSGSSSSSSGSTSSSSSSSGPTSVSGPAPDLENEETVSPNLEIEEEDFGNVLENLLDEIDIDLIAPPSEDEPATEGPVEDDAEEHARDWRFPRRKRAKVVRAEPSRAPCMFSVAMLKAVVCDPTVPWPAFVDVPKPLKLTVPRTKEFDHLDWTAAKRAELDKILERGSLAAPVPMSWTRQEGNDVCVIGYLFCIDNVKHPMSEDEQAKSRYCFQGSNMRDQFGNKISSSEVVSMTIIQRYLPASGFEMRSIIHISKFRGWTAQKFDIKSAYLWATMPEELNVYVRTDKLTERLICESCGWETPRVPSVFPMIAPIYGFVVSGDLWANLLKSVLELPGWKMLQGCDQQVSRVTFYVHLTEDAELDGALAIATDDGALTGAPEIVEAVMAALQEHFEFRELAEFTNDERMLGATYNDVEHADGSFSLSTDMRSYLTAITERVKNDPAIQPTETGKPGPLGKCRFAAIPATGKRVAEAPADPKTDQMDSHFVETAARHVGGYAFGAYSNEFDIAYSVNFLSRHLNSWGYPQDVLLWQLARFVSHPPRSEMVRIDHIDPRDHGSLSWFSFADADLGGCPETRRSTSGFIMIIIGKHGTRITIYAKVKRQNVVSTNTCESECNALSDLVRWLMGHDAFLRLVYGVPEFEFVCSDASAAIAAISKGYSEKLSYLTKKNYALTLGFLREQIADLLRKWPTAFQLADIFTKHLPPAAHWHHVLYSCLMQPAHLKHRCACEECPQMFVESWGFLRCTQMVELEGSKCVGCQSDCEVCRCPCWCGTGSNVDIIYERAPFLRKRFKSKTLEGSYNAYGNGQPAKVQARASKRVRASSGGSSAPVAAVYPVLPPPAVPKAYPVPPVAPREAPVPDPVAVKILAFGEELNVSFPIETLEALRMFVSQLCMKSRTGRVTYKDLAAYAGVSPANTSLFSRGELAPTGGMYARVGNKLLEAVNLPYQEQLLQEESDDSDDSIQLV